MIWKGVPGYGGKYQVSDHGEIRSLRQKSGERMVPLILKQCVVKKNYRRVCLTLNGKCRGYQVARVVLSAFVGPRSSDMHAAHLDGDPSNNRLDNLVWATPKENQEHKRLHGTYTCGERHNRAKLTDVQVDDIIKRFWSCNKPRGSNADELAAEYGVDRATIKAIGNKRYCRLKTPAVI